MPVEFEAYLMSKKIDPEGFRREHSAQYTEWESIYAQVSPESFTQQKLFLINGLRRAYPYTAPPEEKATAAPQKSAKAKPTIAKPNPQKPKI